MIFGDSGMPAVRKKYSNIIALKFEKFNMFIYLKLVTRTKIPNLIINF